MKKHIFVGDVHSNYIALSNIINKFSPEEYKYILLGDYCDYREDDGRGDYINTIFSVMHLVHNYRATALLGNHDDKLLRWFNGSNVDVKEGFLNTIEDIDKSTLDQRKQIHQFLSQLPLTHVEIIKGVEYKFAHAYFADETEIFASALSSTAKEWKAYREHSIWGVPRNLNKSTGLHERVFFWEDEIYRSRVSSKCRKVSGHYHKFFKDEKFIIMDLTPHVCIYIPEDDYAEAFV